MDRTETPENAPGPTSDEARVADSPPGTASGESASPESSSSITSTTGSASANHDDADPRISGESHQSMLARVSPTSHPVSRLHHLPARQLFCGLSVYFPAVLLSAGIPRTARSISPPSPNGCALEASLALGLLQGWRIAFRRAAICDLELFLRSFVPCNLSSHSPIRTRCGEGEC